jgi:tRNA-2-methylthio-N6-dimethylallyladenosine synthase
VEQRNFYIETYGCQMNVADSEIVNSIMADAGFQPVDKPEDSDIIWALLPETDN